MSEFETDNVMPNDGSSFYFPAEPQEQIISRKKEQAGLLEALKVTELMVQHFEERIAFRDTLGSIKVDVRTDPAMHQKMCEVNELLKLSLEEELGLLKDLLETYAKNR